MTGFHLRPPTLTDVKDLLIVEAQCFTVNRLSPRSFRYHIRSRRCDFWIAEAHACLRTPKVAGYALSLRAVNTHYARLYSLAVLPEFRGQGLALLLLDQLETIARTQGRTAIRLEVAESNTVAQALYQRRGYQIFGHLSDYYEDGTAALRLRKDLR